MARARPEARKVPMQDDEQKPYVVEGQAGRFAVRNPAGRTVMVCRDEGSAAEYAVLLNEAYQRGYKAGYSQAGVSKSNPPRPPAATSDLRECG
jgi:hypothetical protein